MWLISKWAVGGSLPSELKPGEFTIGNRKGQIIICDSSISGVHARILVDRRGAATIEDLTNRRGVIINGSISASSRIYIGDRVRLGQVPCLILSHPLSPSFQADEAEELSCEKIFASRDLQSKGFSSSTHSSRQHAIDILCESIAAHSSDHDLLAHIESSLTERQLKVLGAYLSETDTCELAYHLGIKRQTANNFLATIEHKLGFVSRTELVSCVLCAVIHNLQQSSPYGCGNSRQASKTQ